MFKNHIKIAFRNIWNNKFYSSINIVGLAVGMACSFLILLYVLHEFSYEDMHENRDRIFRINERSAFGSRNHIPYPLYNLIINKFPEIQNIANISRNKKFPIPLKINSEFQKINIALYEANSKIFDLFDIQLISGNPKKLNEKGYSIFITEEIVKKYYPNKNPVGEIISVPLGDISNQYFVEGIIKTIPGNTIIQPDLIVNNLFDNIEYENNWNYIPYEYYILINENADPVQLEDKINSFAKTIDPDTTRTYSLQNLSDIRLNSSEFYEEENIIKKMYLASSIGLLILFIACINYIILSLAQNSRRYKEIVIRKVFGAKQIVLLKQLIFEHLLLCFIALPFALVLAERFLPIISQIFDEKLVIKYFLNWKYIIGLFLTTLFIGIFSGSYTSLYLSKLKPANILKNKIFASKSKIILQKFLITIQLLIFVFLILCVLITYRQINYTKSKNMGFNKANLISINFPQNNFNSNYEIFKNL